MNAPEAETMSKARPIFRCTEKKCKKMIAELKKVLKSFKKFNKMKASFQKLARLRKASQNPAPSLRSTGKCLT